MSDTDLTGVCVKGCVKGSNWTLGICLGSGRCCHVFLAEQQSGQASQSGQATRQAAMKLYRSGSNYQAAARREKAILRTAHGTKKNSFIVSVLDHGAHNGQTCLFQDLCDLPLSKIILKSEDASGFSLGIIRRLAADILGGLESLHHLGFIHADLKGSNLLWSAQDGCLKLADFGLSFHQDDQNMGQLQSPGYQAPEVVLWNAGCRDNHKLTNAMDMWSFGCVLLWMVTGKVMDKQQRPTDVCDNCKSHSGVQSSCIHESWVKSLMRHLSTDTDSGQANAWSAFTQLLSRLLVCSAERRLSASEALTHPFIAQDHGLNLSFRDLLMFPTRWLQLLNALDPHTVSDGTDLQDLKDDIVCECQKWGHVNTCVIPLRGEFKAKVFVKFQNASDATLAFSKLNGRLFCDRTLITTYFFADLIEFESNLDDP